MMLLSDYKFKKICIGLRVRSLSTGSLGVVHQIIHHNPIYPKEPNWLYIIWNNGTHSSYQHKQFDKVEVLIEFVNNCLILDAQRYNSMSSSEKASILKYMDLVAILIDENRIKVVKNRYIPCQPSEELSFDKFKELCNKYII